NTWSWGPGLPRPSIRAEGPGLVAEHQELGVLRLTGASGGEALFCENETNLERLFGTPGPAYPKDGINDHVVLGRATVNPARVGTKSALHYIVEAGPGEVAELRLRLARKAGDLDAGWESVLAARGAEAGAFSARLTPAD